MLLRSTSTPILKAFCACQLSTPDLDTTRPVSMSLERTTSEGDFRLFIGAAEEKRPPKCSSAGARSSSSFIKEKEDTISVRMEAAAALSEVDEDLYEEEKIVYTGGGFGGGIGGGDGWWSSSGHNGPYGSQHMDEYYQSMIKLYPGDGLLLANYAKFLKEVRGDNVKAEEVCERAILANATNGNVLSMYADLIWKNHKNGERAQFYFDQAVQSSPDDCYVLASYARFLWNAGDSEENEDGDSDDEEIQFYKNLSQEHMPLVAAS